MPINVSEEGAITIPAKRFNEIVKEIPSGVIDLSVKKNNFVHLENEKSFFKIMGLPKDDFPKLPEIQGETEVVLEQKTLKKILSLTSFAVSHDESRYIFNGALFVFKNNKLRVVTTDGRRLALVDEELDINLNGERQLIVPGKALAKLISILKDEGKLKISWNENQILFDLGGVILISQLIKGDFPNYEQVIPPENKEKIVLSREKFLNATKRVAVFSTQDSISIRLDVLKDKIVFSKISPELGEAKDEIDIDYKGKEISISFNPEYLIDVLKSLDEENVTLEITGEDKPALLRSQKEKYLYLVVPIQNNY
jgi:DNA polymerase-3 subunit beta